MQISSVTNFLICACRTSIFLSRARIFAVQGLIGCKRRKPQHDSDFISYQFAHLRLANFYFANESKDLARAALDTMQARIPPARVKYLGIAAQSIARLYKALGDDKGFRTFIAIASKDYDIRIEE